MRDCDNVFACNDHLVINYTIQESRIIQLILLLIISTVIMIMIMTSIILINYIRKSDNVISIDTIVIIIVLIVIVKNYNINVMLL